MKKFTAITEQIEENKKNIEILSTGFQYLDNQLEGGLLKKELIVVGAPTGKGKSLFAGSLFLNVARLGYKCAYFSLEISNEMIVSRLLGSEANVSPTRVMIKQLADNEQELVEKARIDLSVYEEFMFFHDDLYEYSEIEKNMRENQYDFVVIDFIQNVMHKPIPDEYQRLSYVALSLQKLTKEVNSCTVVLSQLSNIMAKNKKADNMEYKGSGSIATACDLGFYIMPSLMENSFKLELRKNRRGPGGISCEFALQYPGGKIMES